MGYPVPSDEDARLQALADLDVLDEALDPTFDDIVRMAALVCRVPIAIVSFIDAARQLHRSRVGIESPGTLRDVAFCAHTICQRELFVVPDAVNDARFRDNPSVTGDPHIRFYAGQPIVTADDVALGTVCVIDRSPRVLDGAQAEALAILARQAARHLSDRLALRRAASAA